VQDTLILSANYPPKRSLVRLYFQTHRDSISSGRFRTTRCRTKCNKRHCGLVYRYSRVQPCRISTLERQSQPAIHSFLDPLAFATPPPPPPWLTAAFYKFSTGRYPDVHSPLSLSSLVGKAGARQAKDRPSTRRASCDPLNRTMHLLLWQLLRRSTCVVF